MPEQDPLRTLPTDSDVDDVLTTAFEGGSTYWLAVAEVVGGFPDVPSTLFPGEAPFASECLTKGRDLRLTERRDSEQSGAVHVLTLAKMRTGITLAAARFGVTVAAFCENADAADADTALQLAVLGDVIYG